MSEAAQDPVIAAALALTEAVRARFLVDASRTPECVRTMHVARKLCVEDGQDPETVSMGVPGQPPMMAAKGTTGIFAPFQPGWALYWDDAVKMIALVDGTKEVPDARQDSTV